MRTELQFTIAEAPMQVVGTFLRTLSIRRGEEHFHDVSNPEGIIAGLRSLGVIADLFAFSQRLPDTEPRFPYYFEWDNVAAVPLTTYEHWLEEQTQAGTRKQVKRAAKRGIVVEMRPFDDSLVRGIVQIFNETPIRQGRPYPYYGRSYDKVKEGLARHLDRSDFICAYFERELVGFIKFIDAGFYARASVTICKVAHRDKSPMNALIAHAVQLSVERGFRFLVSGKYQYGKKGADGLTEFKRHNGFVRIDLPRFFVPLTLKGRTALALGLHKGFVEVLPEGLSRQLRRLRSTWYEMVRSTKDLCL